MRATIRDRETLATLRPLDVVAYLRSHGWTKAELEPDPDRGSTWVRRDAGGEEFEVSVPMDRELGDFIVRMSELLGVLEVVEHRSQLQILRDLTQISSDVIRVRLVDPELADGSMSLEQGSLCFPRARDLMMSAACAEVSAKPTYEGRKPDDASDYMRRVRLGQTEQGSFVLTILSRVAPALTQADGKPFETEVPFERRVTERLAAALAALKAAVREAAVTNNVEGFVRAVPYGVSANLCEAIVGLAKDEEGDRSLEIGFSWSPVRPVEKQIPDRVVFAPESFPVIEQAAKYLRETSPVEDFEVCGPVVKLERKQGEETGKVTIAAVLEGNVRMIVLSLSGGDYDLAIKAHGEERAVSCRGLLRKSGRTYQLSNVAGFQLCKGE